MARTVATGIQDFGKLINNNYFYVDKTDFIKEWWEGSDDVTLITRPRRFGKTLTMDMVNRFFSNQHKDDARLFEGLSIWKEEKYQKLQGSYPVIFLSFANVKGKTYESTRGKICQLISELYDEYAFLMEKGILTKNEILTFQRKTPDMKDIDAEFAIGQLSKYLCRYYGKKVIILLDEYDTPMQDAYVKGYWDELAEFTRGVFNAAFKTNPYMERAILTGITRMSREPIFSGLNNLQVITAFSKQYASSFGFTQEDVHDALDEFGLLEQEQKVKYWYDGFCFGGVCGIYNPWSITNYLKQQEFEPYWANTSSNGLINSLIREGGGGIQTAMEGLLQGEGVTAAFDKEVVYNRLKSSKGAVWSLMVASGYLKVTDIKINENQESEYKLEITNFEVLQMFRAMITDWFYEGKCDITRFCNALREGDVQEMQKSLPVGWHCVRI